MLVHEVLWGRGMVDLWHDVRYALRTARTAPGLFVAIVITMAVAIGGNSTVFSWVEGVVLHPMAGVSDQDRIVAIAGVREPGGRCCLFSYPDYVDYRDHNSTLDGIVAGELIAPNVSGDGRPERAIGQVVTGNYFDVLRVRARLGRTFLPDEDRDPMAHPVVVISDGFWRRRFAGDPSIVGRTALLNGVQFTVVGVAPREFIGTFVGYSLDLWVPAAMEQVFFPGGDHLKDRGHAWLEGYARLRPGVARQQAQAELDLISKRIQGQFPDDHRGFALRVFPLWRTPYGGLPLVAPILAISAVVVALVLLMACSNVASLLLTRAVRRRHEMAIRLGLGASRARLVRQVLTESCVFGTIGGAVGLLVPLYLREALPYFFPPSSVRITMPGQLDARVLMATALVTIGVGLLFGTGPALQSSSPETSGALKEDGSTITSGRAGGQARAVLLVIQIAVTMVLLIGAGLFLRTLWRVERADLGVDRDHVLIASFDMSTAGYSEGRGRAFLRELVARASRLPGVTSASLAWRLPFSVRGPANAEIRVPGLVPHQDETPFAEYNLVGSNYAQTLGLRIVQGREFSTEDTEQAAPAAIVNETMARRYWPRGDAIGAHFQILGRSVEIVGVARDVPYHSLVELPRPYVYLPILQFYAGQTSLIVRTTGDPGSLMLPVQTLAAAMNSQVNVYSVLPMKTHLGFAVFGQRTAGVLLGTFGVLALVLASLGLYSVVAYGVATRTREIGIRMALGGRAADVLALVMRGGLAISLVGVSAGVVGAVALGRLVASQIYGVSTTDPATYLVSALVVILTATLASLVPAVRAYRIDIIGALRSH